jgi:hypothetical protein
METIRKSPQDKLIIRIGGRENDYIINIVEGRANDIRFRKVAEGIPENKQKIVFGHKLLTRFNNYLDERYGKVGIAGFSFCTSKALNICAPTAYRAYLNGFMRAEGWQPV